MRLRFLVIVSTLLIAATSPVRAQSSILSNWGSCGGGCNDAAPYNHLGCGTTTDFCDCGSSHPSIKFNLDLILLHRNGARSQDFMFDSGANPILNASDLTFPTRAGGRIGFVLYDECGWDLEFNYFGFDQFETSATRTDPAGVNFLFFNGNPATPANAYDTLYQSELHSGEFNVRRRLSENFTVLAGIRGMELDERFDILSGPNSGFFSATDNELWGFQLGAEVLVWSNNYLRLTLGGKAGIFHNEIDLDATAQGVDMVVDDDKAAFVTDGFVNLMIPMGPVCSINLGYQMLFMDGVALAPDQSDDFSMFTHQGQTDFGNPIYHGGYVGLTFVK